MSCQAAGLQHRTWMLGEAQQLVDRHAELEIVSAARAEKRGALHRLEIQHLIQECIDSSATGVGRHVARSESVVAPSSFSSQARARSQYRWTERQERPSASAVSSSVIPAK